MNVLKTREVGGGMKWTKSSIYNGLGSYLSQHPTLDDIHHWGGGMKEEASVFAHEHLHACLTYFDYAAFIAKFQIREFTCTILICLSNDATRD